jgi:histidine triad (HIT) family protein
MPGRLGCVEGVHRVEQIRSGPCVFCSIAKGEVESQIVFRDEQSIAFLDSKPLFPGHCLLIPIAHYETLSQLPRELVGPLFVNVRLIAGAVQKRMNADGSFVAINNRVSQSVPHLHVHIVPRREKDGLRGFFWPRQKYASTQSIMEVQKTLQSTIAELQSKLNW